jgi:chloramphenicol O-acetyltransferase type A
MKTLIDIENWNRKEHFTFFNTFEEPFFGVTILLDVTKAYDLAKENNVNFFTYYLHKTIVAVNKTENFKYRIVNNQVYLYDTIHASATILREDKTFGFSEIVYHENLDVFAQNVITETNRVLETTGLFTKEVSENLIHFSALPWINFTSISHSRQYKIPDSCPKFSFGKMTITDNKKQMPFSVHVHHGLVDGYHVSVFLETLQNLLDGLC